MLPAVKAIAVAASIVMMLGACSASTDLPPNASGTGTPTTTTTSPSASFSPGKPADSASPVTDETPSPGSTGSARRFRTIGSVDDRRGDAGTDARGYNDLVGVRIQDNGQEARLLVRLGADVPDRMPDGEQMGIGIDVYEEPGAEDSTFQVFAAGTSEGWQAFFETPNGFVEFPGTFGIGDDILQFVIPWEAFDDIRGSRFATFLDWDRQTLSVGIAGQDRAPDGAARARFSR